MPYSSETLYIDISNLQDDVKITPRDSAQWSAIITAAQTVLTQLDFDSKNSTISLDNANSAHSILSATIKNLADDSTNADFDNSNWISLNNNFTTYDAKKEGGEFNFEDSSGSLDGKTDDVAYAIKAVEFYGYITHANTAQTDAKQICTSIVTLEILAAALTADLSYEPVTAEITDAHAKAAALLTQVNYIPSSVLSTITEDDDAAVSVSSLQTLSQGDVPADQGDAPADQGDAPADQGDAPADQGDAPADQGDAPAELEPGINTIFRFTLPVSDSKVTSSALVDFATSDSEDFHSEIKITLDHSQTGLVFNNITYSGDTPDNDDGKEGDTVVTTPNVEVHKAWMSVFQGFVTTDPGLTVDTTPGEPSYGSENRAALHALINYLFNVATGATIKSDLEVQTGFRDIINDSFGGGGAQNGVFWSMHNALLNAGRMRDGHVVMETTDMIELVCPIRSDDTDMGSSTNAQANYWNLSVNFLFT